MMASGKLKVLTSQEDSPASPWLPIRVKKSTDAKRLLSRLIYQLQKGEITGQNASDLCCLFPTFITLTQNIEMEQRLEQLEKRFNAKENSDFGETISRTEKN
jgi:hypothetical protein